MLGIRRKSQSSANQRSRFSATYDCKGSIVISRGFEFYSVIRFLWCGRRRVGRRTSPGWRRRTAEQLIVASFQILGGGGHVLLQVTGQAQQVALKVFFHLLEGTAGLLQILGSGGLEAIRAAGQRFDVFRDVLHGEKC